MIGSEKKEVKDNMGKLGVFETAKEAVAAAATAQKELVKNYTLEDRDRFIAQIRAEVGPRIEEFAIMEFEETGYGRVEDKIAKDTGAVYAGQGTEAIPTGVIASDKGLTVEYYAPYGVIGAVTPVTNPVATIVANTISVMAGGNTVVFNAHPGSVKCATEACHAVNQAIINAGGPENICTMPAIPTMETLDDIINSPEVSLLVGTGGPGMVKTLMASGKKVIAAGPGNPPSIIDSSCNVKKAAAGVAASATFDNNLLCIAEKEIFVVADVYDEFIKELEALGNYKMTREEADKVTAIGIVELPGGGYATNKKYVGKHAKVILADAGIEVEGDPRMAFFEAENDDLYVQVEQMQPIIPVVKCKDFEEAMGRAVAAEHNCKHSASIWSNDIEHVTAFGKVINTTVFVQNGGTMAAFGLGGSGTNSPTIATPTGEGATGPQSFLRRRRFCMAGGGNYLL